MHCSALYRVRSIGPFDSFMVSSVYSVAFLPEFPDSQIPRFLRSQLPPIISLTVNYRLHAGGETMHCLCLKTA